MRNHPVNPMDDSDLRRLMERQSRGTCALINAQMLESGEAAVRDGIKPYPPRAIAISHWTH